MRTTVLALVALSSAPAHADELTRVDQSMRWEGAFGVRVGSFHVGTFDGMGYGFHLDGGVRFDRTLVYGEYSYLSLSNAPPDNTAAQGGMATQPPEIDGIAQRVGVNARYSVGKITGEEVPLRGDFWLEAGVGREYLRWYGGGKLTRNDVSLGLGGQITVRWGQSKHKKVGLFYALKMTGARRADAKEMPPTCAGPCDEPTGPMPYDLGIFFDVAVPFGR